MPATILICTWEAARERAGAIRISVFVEEQGVP
ncbi:GNAT family N-acetyltransferase, partial [Enterococcus faecalis]